MGKVRRYRPKYFSGFDDDVASVETLDELLSVPWVAEWKLDKRFHKFSVSGRYLMAELDNGRKWWVVAFFVDGNDEFELPQWNPVVGCEL